MRSYFFFHNEFELLSHLEDEDGFIEIETPFELLSNFQLDDMVTKSIEGYTGEKIELHLLVNSRMFDFVKDEFSVQCQIGTPIEEGGNNLGFGQSLN